MRSIKQTCELGAPVRAKPALRNRAPSARSALGDFKPFVREMNGTIQGRFGDIWINSSFQPIYSIAHRRAVGYEALIRPQFLDGAPLSPLAVFDMARSDSTAVFLDRLCRLVHIGNFQKQMDDTSWLFLNINPLVSISGQCHGSFFSEALEQSGIAPHRIVVEILEDKIRDESQLAESVKFFKELGCLVAIDDFGAGHSNFERIWRIQPHLVKLDRSIITQAAGNQSVRRALPNLVNMIHEAGSLALIEGIENEQEALVAMETDADFMQGYYFARPSPILPPREQDRAFIDELGQKFAQVSKDRIHAHKIRLHDYRDAFELLHRQFKAGTGMAAACQAFLGLPSSERCYLLSRKGMQVGVNLTPPNARTTPDPRFLPLSDSRDATWARRHYFRRAVSSPGEIQVSRPYLSLSGGNMCVTLSVAVFSGKEIVVLCGDLRWDEHASPL